MGKRLAEIKKEEISLKQKIYTIKNVNRYTVEIHCDSHRFSHLQMESTVEYVLYQLPHESTKVRYLLATIKCTDTDLRARIANINCSNNQNGKQHDLELTGAFILLACPVALRLARGDPVVENKTVLV